MSVILLASELATNAILHSRSGHPGRVFTVRATLYPGDYAWVEVIDQGGAWTADELDDEHGRGLASLPLSLGTATGASMATPHAASRGSGSTGTTRESANWTRERPAQVQAGRRAASAPKSRRAVSAGRSPRRAALHSPAQRGSLTSHAAKHFSY